MGFVIAILLTLAMAGSVLWVMPSPREKRISAMRKRAMECSARVRLIDKAMATQMIPWVDDHRGYVSYELGNDGGASASLKGFKVVRLSFDANLHELDMLDPLRQRVEAAGLLSAWPESAEALVFSPLGVAVIWREVGTEDDIQGLVEKLRLCLSSCFN